MFWNRMKTIAAVLVAMVTVTGTAGLLARGTLASSLAGNPERSSPPSRQIENGLGTAPGSTVTLAALDPQASGKNRPASSSRQRSPPTTRTR